MGGLLIDTDSACIGANDKPIKGLYAAGEVGLTDMDVSENSGISPKSSHFHRVFHYKPSILGYPYFRKHPYGWGQLFTLFDYIPSLKPTVRPLKMMVFQEESPDFQWSTFRCELLVSGRVCFWSTPHPGCNRQQ